jgi:hypothetical protein
MILRRNKAFTLSLAFPVLIIMDLCSDNVDFPWWAYMFLLLGSVIVFHFND